MSSETTETIKFECSSFGRLLSCQGHISHRRSVDSTMGGFSRLGGFRLSVYSTKLDDVSLVYLLLGGPSFGADRSGSSNEGDLVFFQHGETTTSTVSNPGTTPSTVAEVSFSNTSVVRLRVFSLPPTLVRLVLLFLRDGLGGS